jgi:hypothetical protein
LESDFDVDFVSAFDSDFGFDSDVESDFDSALLSELDPAATLSEPFVSPLLEAAAALFPDP